MGHPLYKRNNFPEHSFKAKNSFFVPFTFKIADLFKDIRVKGAEKQAGSLSNGPKKWAVSVCNMLEKWAGSLHVTNIIKFGTVTQT